MRKIINGKKKKSDLGFRYRGLNPTRLENLTDTIFGFIITLLVISSEVPKTYLELQISMYSFIGFVFCSLLLLIIWNNHRVFFLHYGLQDGIIRILNIFFLFILLFYVYPLKYLFSYIGTALYVKIKLALGDQSESLKHVIINLTESSLETEQWKDIMIRFGLGLFSIYMILLFMYIHAFKKRKLLHLNKKEKYLTKSAIQVFLFLILITLISMSIVFFFGGAYAQISGLAYLLIPIILFVHKRFRLRRFEKILKNKVYKILKKEDEKNQSITLEENSVNPEKIE